MEDADEVYQILRDIKVLARRYYQLTRKPLGVTGEIAEYEAARHLNVELELARQAGYDATEVRDGADSQNSNQGAVFHQPTNAKRPSGINRFKATLRYCFTGSSRRGLQRFPDF